MIVPCSTHVNVLAFGDVEDTGIPSVLLSSLESTESSFLAPRRYTSNVLEIYDLVNSLAPPVSIIALHNLRTPHCAAYLQQFG